jgi:hypothetical protein
VDLCGSVDWLVVFAHVREKEKKQEHRLVVTWFGFALAFCFGLTAAVKKSVSISRTAVIIPTRE